MKDKVFILDVDGVLTPGNFIYIGTGKQTSIQEVVNICSRLTGYTPNCLWNEDKRSWDTNNWVADCSKTQKLLGWKCQTDLESGLKKTIEWTKKYGK